MTPPPQPDDDFGSPLEPEERRFLRRITLVGAAIWVGVGIALLLRGCQ